ncbi:hypothetical protein ACFLRM_04250 [Acidobacteriota bacterium]
MHETKRETLKDKQKKNGIILFVTLLVIVVLTISIGPLLLNLSTTSRLTEKEFKSNVAFNLAEAAVERAIWELNFGDISSWGEGPPWQTTLSDIQAAGGDILGDININVIDIDPMDNVIIVEGTGIVPFIGEHTVNRKVRVALKKSEISLFDYGIFADDWILLREGTHIDSYNSNDGEYDPETNKGANGHIGTNNRSRREDGSIIVQEDGSLVEGGAESMNSWPDQDESYDINSVIVEGDDGEITGSVAAMEEEKPLPPLNPPSSLPWNGDLNLEGEIHTITESGEYQNIQFKETNLIFDNQGNSEPIEIVASGNFLSNDSSVITLLGDTQVKIYVEGLIDIAGGTQVNTSGDPSLPANFIFIYTGEDIPGTVEVDFREFSDFYGVVYAPTGDVRLREAESPEVTFNGAVVGKTIEMQEARSFHFDEAIKESIISDDFGSGSWVVTSWQEKYPQ